MTSELAAEKFDGGSTAAGQPTAASGIGAGEEGRDDHARPQDSDAPQGETLAGAAEESDAAADSRAARHTLRTLHAFLDPEHLPANDDFETAGQLTRLVKRRRRRSFAIAALAGAFSWMIICGLLLSSDRQHIFSNLFVRSPVSVMLLAFLGLFGVSFLLMEAAKRSQELHATTQSLIEVVLRIASPASALAQSLHVSEQVSSEVSRIDASLEKTIARGAEVRASLATERDAFIEAHRKASEDLSGLMAQMASERAALVVDGENIRCAISNAQRYLNLDIRNAVHLFSEVSEEFKEKVNQAFEARDGLLEARFGDMCKDCMSQIDTLVDASIARIGERFDSQTQRFAQVLSGTPDQSDQHLLRASEEHLVKLDKLLNTLLNKANLDVNNLGAVEKLIERLSTGLDDRLKKLNTVLASGIIELHKSTKDTMDGHTVQVETLRELTAGIKSETEHLIGRLAEQMSELRKSVVLPLNEASIAFDYRQDRLTVQTEDFAKSFDSIISKRIDAISEAFDSCLAKVERLPLEDAAKRAAAAPSGVHQDKRSEDREPSLGVQKSALASTAPEEMQAAGAKPAGTPASALSFIGPKAPHAAKPTPSDTGASPTSGITTPFKAAGTSSPNLSRQDRSWLTDILERASLDETGSDVPEQVDKDAGGSTKEVIATLARDIRILVKPDAVGDAWANYQGGQEADFSSVYTNAGTIGLQRLRDRLQEDEHLRRAVEVYLKTFTRTLMRLPQGDELWEYLQTDAGMTYTVLVDAMGAFQRRSKLTRKLLGHR